MYTQAMTTFRTGRSLGRTIYKNDKLIGIMDRPEDATMIVDALNEPEPDWPLIESSSLIPDAELDRIVAWVEAKPERKNGTGMTVWKLATELRELRLVVESLIPEGQVVPQGGQKSKNCGGQE